jgi:mono/diheme cytochrome c family protein
LAERWLGEADNPLQRAVIALADDPDWAVRQHVAASIGSLPAGRRESAIAGVLDKYGSDPVMTDVALSGVRGSERAVLGLLLQVSERSSGRESAITMLAATIIKSAQQDAIGELFESTAESRRAGWQRAALLRGAEVAILGAAMPGTPAPRPSSNTTTPCATCPGGRAGPGGAYAFPRPPDWPSAPARSNAPAVRLLREPKPLVDLAADAGELGTRATAVLARVSWPGKVGDAAAPRALTAGEQQQFERGREVYRNICQGCHQPDGRGLERIAPSLIGSRFALANAEVAIRILMNGKEGTTGLMPPVGGTLDDAQIASVLIYVRREWGQTGDPVPEATVGKIRAAAAGRTRPWTDAELDVLLTGGSPR